MNELAKYSLNAYSDFKVHYSDTALWNKLLKVFTKAGIKVTYIALLLFYVMKSPDVPIVEKTKIIGALGYFILPLDLVPDWIPVAGYSDDLTALLWALKIVSCHITPKMRMEAEAQLHEWYGDFDAQVLNQIW